MIDKAATTDTTKGFMSDDPSDLPQASLIFRKPVRSLAHVLR